MEQSQSLLAAIAGYIERDLGRGPLALTPDTPLIESGLIDSLTLFKLIDFVQRQTAIRVEPAEITLDNFGTPAAIERLVAAKRGATSR